MPFPTLKPFVTTLLTSPSASSDGSDANENSTVGPFATTTSTATGPPHKVKNSLLAGGNLETLIISLVVGLLVIMLFVFIILLACRHRECGLFKRNVIGSRRAIRRALEEQREELQRKQSRSHRSDSSQSRGGSAGAAPPPLPLHGGGSYLPPDIVLYRMQRAPKGSMSKASTMSSTNVDNNANGGGIAPYNPHAPSLSPFPSSHHHHTNRLIAEVEAGLGAVNLHQSPHDEEDGSGGAGGARTTRRWWQFWRSSSNADADEEGGEEMGAASSPQGANNNKKGSTVTAVPSSRLPPHHPVHSTAQERVATYGDATGNYEEEEDVNKRGDSQHQNPSIGARCGNTHSYKHGEPLPTLPPQSLAPSTATLATAATQQLEASPTQQQQQQYNQQGGGAVGLGGWSLNVGAYLKGPAEANGNAKKKPTSSSSQQRQPSIDMGNSAEIVSTQQHHRRSHEHQRSLSSTQNNVNNDDGRGDVSKPVCNVEALLTAADAAGVDADAIGQGVSAMGLKLRTPQMAAEEGDGEADDEGRRGWERHSNASSTSCEWAEEPQQPVRSSYPHVTQQAHTVRAQQGGVVNRNAHDDDDDVRSVASDEADVYHKGNVLLPSYLFSEERQGQGHTAAIGGGGHFLDPTAATLAPPKHCPRRGADAMPYRNRSDNDRRVGTASADEGSDHSGGAPPSLYGGVEISTSGHHSDHYARGTGAAAVAFAPTYHSHSPPAGGAHPTAINASVFHSSGGNHPAPPPILVGTVVSSASNRIQSWADEQVLLRGSVVRPGGGVNNNNTCSSMNDQSMRWNGANGVGGGSLYSYSHSGGGNADRASHCSSGSEGGGGVAESFGSSSLSSEADEVPAWAQ